MLPLIKLVSLVIRVFTRPVIIYLKKTTIRKNHLPWLRIFLVGIGQQSHSISVKITRRFNRSAGKYAPVRPLIDPIALERGAELLSEISIYGTLLTFGCYEIYKYAAATRLKIKK
jgi:hypothetical protein